jgi:hypothetical protein
MIHRLGTDIISGIQMYISNQVILFREQNEVRGRNTGESLELVNSFTRDTVTIEGMTRGEVIRFDPTGMSLDVCFEQSREQTVRFVLTERGFFEMDIYDGTALYNHVPYRVLAAERPRLLVKLENRGSVVEEKRYAPGRSVGNRDSEPADKLLERREWPESGAAPEPPVYQRPSSHPEPAPEALPEWGYGAPPSLAGPGFPTAESPVIIDAPISGSRDGGTCLVQVGSYIGMDKAQEAFDRLVAAGFSPDYERHNEYYRVVISGVSLQDIDAITGQLYSAGFSDPWIREE